MKIWVYKYARCIIKLEVQAQLLELKDLLIVEEGE